MNPTVFARFLSVPALAVLLGGACSFQPVVPNNSVSCDDDLECPQGYQCRPYPGDPTVRVCCRGTGCGQGADPEEPADSAAPTPASLPPRPDAGTMLAPDAEVVRPPVATAPDAGGDLAPAGDGGIEVKSLVGCSSSIEMPLPALAGRQSYCTIVANNAYVYLSLDLITMNDPVSVRAYSICSAAVPLGAETTGEGAAGEALGKPTLELVVKLVNHYKQLCQPHGAQLVGLVGTAWARAATNQNEIKARLKEGTGLDLDIPTPDQELQQRYYGVSRHRRGRIVLDPSYDKAELLTWPQGAPALTRTIIPVAWSQAGPMYFSHIAYQSFEEARKALRARLSSELAAPLATLAEQVKQGTLASTVSVGPVGPLVPMALAGELRSSEGAWFDVARWKMASDAATVTTTPYGRAYGIVLPAQVDKFFSSITGSQFSQLRTNPIRDAYGIELLYDTTLLDLLADEAKATEFGFVFTNAHFGYLFMKLFPAPR
jgi:hypothetical protein